ncbi:MAG: hypothetical protein LUH02_05155 [Erysipelotrichaceae bacterium]|nr:hypothetical protein [Erysipelotrichaceae bacterium]
MKKKYEKPGLIFESFELSQSVAQDCGENAVGKTNHWSISTCGYKWGQGYIWVSTENGCGVIGGADDLVDGYCYDTPVPGMQIFSS